MLRGIAKGDKVALDEVLQMVAGSVCHFLMLAPQERRKVATLPTSIRVDSVTVHIPLDRVVSGGTLASADDVARGKIRAGGVALTSKGVPRPHPACGDKPSKDAAAFVACGRGLFDGASLSLRDLRAAAVMGDEGRPARITVIDPGVKNTLTGLSCSGIEEWILANQASERMRREPAFNTNEEPRPVQLHEGGVAFRVEASATGVAYSAGDATRPTGYDGFRLDPLYERRLPAEEAIAGGGDPPLRPTIRHLHLSRGEYQALTGARVGVFRGRHCRAYKRLEAQIREAASNRGLSHAQRKKRVFKLRRRLRRMGWRPVELDDVVQQLKDGGSLKVSTLCRVEAAARMRLHLLLDPAAWWRFHGSKAAAQLRSEAALQKGRGMAEILRRFAPGRRDVVVVGDFAQGGRQAIKGESGRSPVVSLRRYFAQNRRTVQVGEWGTTKRCPACELVGHDEGSKMLHPPTARMQKSKRAIRRQEERQRRRHQTAAPGIPAPAAQDGQPAAVSPHKPYHKVLGTSHCQSCGRTFPRDTASALNLSKAFFSLAAHGARPAYLKPDLATGEGNPLATTG
jgi:hypothetical protein